MVTDLPLPKIPRDELLRARVCPTRFTSSVRGPTVLCASPVELSTEQQASAEKALVAYFPAGAVFDFFWPTEPPSGQTPDLWFEALLDEHFPALPS
jgi:hypothetical protein